MAMLSENFNALLNEAQFTLEMLGSGATQIRKANYTAKGKYFQALTSLSTGVERIGKLCLILDHYLDTGGQFPSHEQMKNEIGHDLEKIYRKSQEITQTRGITLDHLQDLSSPIHEAILRSLSNFAKGDRYSNINLITGSRQNRDPIADWFNGVEKRIYDSVISARKKKQIKHQAQLTNALIGNISYVLQSSETGDEITDLETAIRISLASAAIAPFRQLNVLQVIRYWTNLLRELQYLVQAMPGCDIPNFSEMFGRFGNEDGYLRTRKTWEQN
jgi:hypothetical protein